MRSVSSRLRLRSQALIVPARVACSGSTLLTRKTSSRRPAIAAPTTRSGPAVGVHLRGVDQVHAEIESEAERRDLLLPPAAVIAHHPGRSEEHTSELQSRFDL